MVLKEEDLVDAIDSCKQIASTDDKQKLNELLEHALSLAKELLQERIEWEEGGCP
jgi:hypothetical protein